MRLMRRPVVLACALLSALVSPPATALVGGAQPADAAVARHVVQILGGQSLCTGVAIAPDLVLTAAHCVLDGKVRIVTTEGRATISREVAGVAAHPQFSSRTDAPDIAMLKIGATATSRLTPAALSERRAPPSVGDRFIVAGYGVAVQGDRKSAGKLRAATLVATDRPNSQLLSLIDPRKLGEKAGLGVCHGDSGGPVLDENDRTLVGIISWSAGTQGEPTCGFVSGVIPLARYRYWLEDTAAKLGSALAP